VDRLRRAIVEGRLAAGDRLPATRVLAGELAVSRGVVVDAYQRLLDEGLVRARTGAGTVVASPGTPHPPRPTTDRRHTTSSLRLPMPRPDGIDLDLSPGVPDLAAFPRTAWLRAERAVLEQVTGADLGYGDPGGSPRLRQELIGWLARTRGVRAEADDVIVVGGVAQGLALLSQTLPPAAPQRPRSRTRGREGRATRWRTGAYTRSVFRSTTRAYGWTT
jgi:GntR family transcriptional regulator/MocR family aminotransferase